MKSVPVSSASTARSAAAATDAGRVRSGASIAAAATRIAPGLIYRGVPQNLERQLLTFDAPHSCAGASRLFALTQQRPVSRMTADAYELHFG